MLNGHQSGCAPGLAQLIEEVINLQKIPQQAYRSCLGILRMGKRYGNDRLENAAIRALYLGAFRYKSIESILQNGLDNICAAVVPQTCI